MDFNAIRFKTKCIRVMLPTYDQVGKVAMLTARMKPFTACLVLNYVHARSFSGHFLFKTDQQPTTLLKQITPKFDPDKF